MARGDAIPAIRTDIRFVVVAPHGRLVELVLTRAYAPGSCLSLPGNGSVDFSESLRMAISVAQQRQHRQDRLNH
jgi:hypothetical protein